MPPPSISSASSPAVSPMPRARGGDNGLPVTSWWAIRYRSSAISLVTPNLARTVSPQDCRSTGRVPPAHPPRPVAASDLPASAWSALIMDHLFRRRSRMVKPLVVAGARDGLPGISISFIARYLRLYEVCCTDSYTHIVLHARHIGNLASVQEKCAAIARRPSDRPADRTRDGHAPNRQAAGQSSWPVPRPPPRWRRIRAESPVLNGSLVRHIERYPPPLAPVSAASPEACVQATALCSVGCRPRNTRGAA